MDHFPPFISVTLALFCQLPHQIKVITKLDIKLGSHMACISSLMWFFIFIAILLSSVILAITVTSQPCCNGVEAFWTMNYFINWTTLNLNCSASHGQPALDVPFQAGRWKQETSRGALQPTPFCNTFSFLIFFSLEVLRCAIYYSSHVSGYKKVGSLIKVWLQGIKKWFPFLSQGKADFPSSVPSSGSCEKELVSPGNN